MEGAGDDKSLKFLKQRLELQDAAKTGSGKGWKKYEFPATDLQKEKTEANLTLTSTQLRNEVLHKLKVREYLSRRQDNKEESVFWSKKRRNIEYKKMREQVNQDFINDFVLWLQGKSDYNQPEVPKLVHRKDGEEIKSEITYVSGTPWGRKPLFYVNGVPEFLDQAIDRRADTVKIISKLESTGPRNINEAYLYYKYIVRQMAIDENGIVELNEFSQYDYPNNEGEIVGTGPLGPPQDPILDDIAFREYLREISDNPGTNPETHVLYYKQKSPEMDKYEEAKREIEGKIQLAERLQEEREDELQRKLQEIEEIEDAEASNIAFLQAMEEYEAYQKEREIKEQELEGELKALEDEMNANIEQFLDTSWERVDEGTEGAVRIDFWWFNSAKQNLIHKGLATPENSESLVFATTKRPPTLMTATEKKRLATQITNNVIESSPTGELKKKIARHFLKESTGIESVDDLKEFSRVYRMTRDDFYRRENAIRWIFNKNDGPYFFRKDSLADRTSDISWRNAPFEPEENIEDYKEFRNARETIQYMVRKTGYDEIPNDELDETIGKVEEGYFFHKSSDTIPVHDFRRVGSHTLKEIIADYMDRAYPKSKAGRTMKFVEFLVKKGQTFDEALKIAKSFDKDSGILLSDTIDLRHSSLKTYPKPGDLERIRERRRRGSGPKLDLLREFTKHVGKREGESGSSFDTEPREEVSAEESGESGIETFSKKEIDLLERIKEYQDALFEQTERYRRGEEAFRRELEAAKKNQKIYEDELKKTQEAMLSGKVVEEANELKIKIVEAEKEKANLRKALENATQEEKNKTTELNNLKTELEHMRAEEAKKRTALEKVTQERGQVENAAEGLKKEIQALKGEVQNLKGTVEKHKQGEQKALNETKAVLAQKKKELDEAQNRLGVITMDLNKKTTESEQREKTIKQKEIEIGEKEVKIETLIAENKELDKAIGEMSDKLVEYIEKNKKFMTGPINEMLKSRTLLLEQQQSTYRLEAFAAEMEKVKIQEYKLKMDYWNEYLGKMSKSNIKSITDKVVRSLDVDFMIEKPKGLLDIVARNTLTNQFYWLTHKENFYNEKAFPGQIFFNFMYGGYLHGLSGLGSPLYQNFNFNNADFFARVKSYSRELVQKLQNVNQNKNDFYSNIMSQVTQHDDFIQKSNDIKEIVNYASYQKDQIVLPNITLSAIGKSLGQVSSLGIHTPSAYFDIVKKSDLDYLLELIHLRGAESLIWTPYITPPFLTERMYDSTLKIEKAEELAMQPVMKEIMFKSFEGGQSIETLSAVKQMYINMALGVPRPIYDNMKALSIPRLKNGSLDAQPLALQIGIRDLLAFSSNVPLTQNNEFFGSIMRTFGSYYGAAVLQHYNPEAKNERFEVANYYPPVFNEKMANEERELTLQFSKDVATYGLGTPMTRPKDYKFNPVYVNNYVESLDSLTRHAFKIHMVDLPNKDTDNLVLVVDPDFTNRYAKYANFEDLSPTLEELSKHIPILLYATEQDLAIQQNVVVPYKDKERYYLVKSPNPFTPENTAIAKKRMADTLRNELGLDPNAELWSSYINKDLYNLLDKTKNPYMIAGTYSPYFPIYIEANIKHLFKGLEFEPYAVTKGITEETKREVSQKKITSMNKFAAEIKAGKWEIGSQKHIGLDTAAFQAALQKSYPKARLFNEDWDMFVTHISRDNSWYVLRFGKELKEILRVQNIKVADFQKTASKYLSVAVPVKEKTLSKRTNFQKSPVAKQKQSYTDQFLSWLSGQ